ncbi:MAG TPA: nucleoside-diphosphate kinase [Candidatus Dojkabacteria bacterium]|nr:nucleoside-diphosphate kinase [Candidatus Dojkabacteria bacterium]HOR06011.1 nucleoside-diphosphate kinase [Candidatus Dojkabacteria bacterium]HOT60751.1 nucleoside-diphosphate kinase [Candidatus Dojkabacteria bacterium]HQI92584.1 nucleoside-diphosphate kinase [Candidatus Dojkabacteria bacterium]
MKRPSIAEERTLILMKPDVLQRQIVGEILSRFERKGFKMVAVKMLNATKAQVGEHYTSEEQYLIETGEKAKKGAEARGQDVSNWNSLEWGKIIRDRNIAYLTCGPILAVVLEGPNVVSSVRKVLGSTSPADGDVGTIRADYSFDSYALADVVARSTRTMLHASDSPENAQREIKIWFKESEICNNYETVAEKIFYDTGWDNA